MRLTPSVALVLLFLAACNGEGLVVNNPCLANEVFVGGACICPPGTFGAACTACDCPQGTDCEDGKNGSGACSGVREAACDAGSVPAHATAVRGVQTVSYSDSTGWGAPAACDWVCGVDFYAQGAGCVNQRQVACADVAPDHATSVIADVTVAYTTAGGFADPTECAWSCDADYFDTGDTCINEDLAPCTDAPPPGASSIFADVTITYTDAGGWSTPAACDWACNPGFRLVGLGCVDAPTVVSTTPVENGVAGTAPVVIAFSESMSTATTELAFQISPPTPGTLTWEASATRLTFVPSSNFANQALYTVTMATTATDLNGNALDAPVSVTFYGEAWVMFYGSHDDASGETNGNLIARAGGLGLPNASARVAADALCTASAFSTRPAVCGNSVAFLSVTPSDQARDLVDANGLLATSEVRTPTGAVVEPHWPDLFDGSVQIVMSQNGIYNDDFGRLYWTGSNVDGTFNSGNQETACSNWTNGTVSAFGQHGWPHYTHSQWIARGGIACQNTEHLLCLCW